MIFRGSTSAPEAKEHGGVGAGGRARSAFEGEHDALRCVAKQLAAAREHASSLPPGMPMSTEGEDGSERFGAVMVWRPSRLPAPPS